MEGRLEGKSLVEVVSEGMSKVCKGNVAGKCDWEDQHDELKKMFEAYKEMVEEEKRNKKAEYDSQILELVAKLESSKKMYDDEIEDSWKAVEAVQIELGEALASKEALKQSSEKSIEELNEKTELLEKKNLELVGKVNDARMELSEAEKRVRYLEVSNKASEITTHALVSKLSKEKEQRIKVGNLLMNLSEEYHILQLSFLEKYNKFDVIVQYRDRLLLESQSLLKDKESPETVDSTVKFPARLNELYKTMESSFKAIQVVINEERFINARGVRERESIVNLLKQITDKGNDAATCFEREVKMWKREIDENNFQLRQGLATVEQDLENEKDRRAEENNKAIDKLLVYERVLSKLRGKLQCLLKPLEGDLLVAQSRPKRGRGGEATVTYSANSILEQHALYRQLIERAQESVREIGAGSFDPVVITKSLVRTRSLPDLRI